ncbi:CAMK family protein kinase [Tritrichomonas foetus]|uniref:CAMK family protein kinase n=1 Tax=Tritrichomonas foetus TaxID=1144522 RepID=A0A1J4KBV2_9EUKA|nr:CAMK family protein kinase [Tritrichomonas foetus]|eukprot:OHT08707.1 CAMK family protein kinase [Tritrichomonas foetus]
MSRTAVVMKTALQHLCICKCIERSRLGGEAQVEAFINTIMNAGNVRSRFLLPYSEVIPRNEYIFLIRPFLNSPTLEQQIVNDSINPNQNGYYVLWKTIVHSFRKLHAANIAPNFVRPSNIFISDDGGPIITDIYPPIFNAANPQCAQSLLFLAPEFLTGDDLPGKPADSWSLGLLLLFIMTGQSPWDTKNLFKMMQNIMKGSEGLNVEVPEEIKPIIEASVVVNPANRSSLLNLSKFNPVVSNIERGSGTNKDRKLSKNSIRAQQSVLMMGASQPKPKKQICTRQSLANLPSIPSFMAQEFQSQNKKSRGDPFMMD